MTEIVGVLNITPDSINGAGLYMEPGEAATYANSLLKAGAVFVDVGAQATNPWATPITSEQEWQRLGNVLPALLDVCDSRISVDTFNPYVAERALQMGQLIINDVMTFRNPELREVVARYKGACIISHAPSEAKTIAEAHAFQIDDLDTVVGELLQRKQELVQAGILENRIILDPGIGFGKTMRLNWELLTIARLLRGHKVMIGHSHKRFLATDPLTGKPLSQSDEVIQKVKASKEANIAAAKVALTSTPAYLRVHDVAAHLQLLDSLAA